MYFRIASNVVFVYQLYSYMPDPKTCLHYDEWKAVSELCVSSFRPARCCASFLILSLPEEWPYKQDRAF